MILLDTNVVVAAHRDAHPHHVVVRPWFDAVLSGDERFAVPDVAWASFVRIVTNRRIFDPPSTLDEAFGFLRAVRAQPHHVTVKPGPRHIDLFEEQCRRGEVSGDLVPDAYLAAIAVEHGSDLVSLDRDFARFPDLRWRRPATGDDPPT